MTVNKKIPYRGFPKKPRYGKPNSSFSFKLHIIQMERVGRIFHFHCYYYEFFTLFCNLNFCCFFVIHYLIFFFVFCGFFNYFLNTIAKFWFLYDNIVQIGKAIRIVCVSHKYLKDIICCSIAMYSPRCCWIYAGPNNIAKSTPLRFFNKIKNFVYKIMRDEFPLALHFLCHTIQMHRTSDMTSHNC